MQFYKLPFEALPKVMVRYLPLHITKNGSLFPKKGGISKYFSPHVLLKRWMIDFRNVFGGDYVQAKIDLDPKNLNLHRSIDVIYLQPLDSLQGEH